MILSLKVKPNSRQESIAKEGATWIVRVRAPATEGKANKAVIDFLSDAFRIPKSRIEIISGHSSSFKRLTIPDEFEEEVRSYKL